MTTESAKAAKARYDAKTARYFSLKLNRNTDGELIKHLEQQESIQAYLKQLIRNDMKKGESTMKTYRIKPEFIELWGPDASEETILTEDEIKTQAEYAEIPLDEIMNQVYPDTPSEVWWYQKMAEKENRYHH